MTQHKCLTKIDNAIIYDDTSKEFNYRQLSKNPKHKKIWKQSFFNELVRLSQGGGGLVDGTYIMFFIAQDQVHIYQLKDVTYGCIVVYYQSHKEEPNRTRLTVGGDLFFCAGDISTPTADITTANLIINSTISTPGARYMCCDINNFYLGIPLSRYEYIKIPIDILPEYIILEYNFMNLSHNRYVYYKIQEGMYSLPRNPP